MDLASDMIQMQARRDSRPGIAYPPDTHWQRNSKPPFPTGNPDQVLAIADVKHDMQHPRPMDRLLCGDVGYGKTEVAMRAAFKAIDAGHQVAVLVSRRPMLAEQHRRTFTRTDGGIPVSTSQVLSRFCTKAGSSSGRSRVWRPARSISWWARTDSCRKTSASRIWAW